VRRWLDRAASGGALARPHHDVPAPKPGAADEADLARGMHYPTRWDPFFEPYMTLADVYRYAAQHFAFHQRQLTLGR
jgi:hypothetical protein